MTDRRVLFDAVLEPNRPLSPRAILLLVGAVALVSFVAGIAFILRGAWPVTPFFGLDVLLLGWALSANARAAERHERVMLTPDRLVIERVGRKGFRSREEVNPYWLRVEHDDPERLGADLALVERGRRIVIGAFLGAEDRASLAEALRDALREARTAR